MNRIDENSPLTACKHADTMLALWELMADLKTTLEASEAINTVLRQRGITIIQTARLELERCQSISLDSMRRTGRPTEPNHPGLLDNLALLETELKLALPLLTLDSLLVMDGQIAALDSCREPYKWSRRSMGYVR